MATDHDALRTRTGTTDRPGIRRDVEGLRAVAVGLVVLYHVGVPFVPGGFVGVDVFFVISGFLITGLLLRELERTGRISLLNFYARRAKRLLPAAGIVLVATALLVRIVESAVDWRTFGGDIAAAAGYVINWRLAERSVDYLAEDVGVSPVQHYWSLAVEEQFYIVWPLLILAVAWWVRRTGMSARRVMAVCLLAVLIPSLVWSIVMTENNPAEAYFVTSTRMWELAIGAMVAIGAARLKRLPRLIAAVIAWLGLAAIVAAGVGLSASVAWPGYAALLPTLGTAAVIAAGPSAGDAGPVRILGVRPALFIGGLSYSIYLWHWPIIVFAETSRGATGPLQGAVAVAVTVVLAWLTLKIVENPIRFSAALRRSPRLALSVGANFTFVSIVAGLSLIIAVANVTRPAEQSQPSGAAVLGVSPATYVPPTQVETITPDPILATADVPDAYADGCQADQETDEPVRCDYGEDSGAVAVALVGDSKALQWVSALDILGQQKGWSVRTYTKSACSFSAAPLSTREERYESCDRWNEAVLAALLADPPDLVVTSQGANTAMVDRDDPGAGKSVEAMATGLAEHWQTLMSAGISVAVLRDNPHPSGGGVSPVYECVLDHSDDLAKCTFLREQGERVNASESQLRAVGETGAKLIDLNEYVCPNEQCPPVIGDVLVYRQGSHLTRTYVDTLAGALGDRLDAVIDDL